MPDLDDTIYKQYADRDVVVYGLYPSRDVTLLDDFIEQTGLSFPVLPDEGSAYLFDFADGTGYPYPKDVVIGPDLTIRSVKNSFNVEETEALVLELLAERDGG